MVWDCGLPTEMSEGRAGHGTGAELQMKPEEEPARRQTVGDGSYKFCSLLCNSTRTRLQLDGRRHYLVALLVCPLLLTALDSSGDNRRSVRPPPLSSDCSPPPSPSPSPSLLLSCCCLTLGRSEIKRIGYR